MIQSRFPTARAANTPTRSRWPRSPHHRPGPGQGRAGRQGRRQGRRHQLHRSTRTPGRDRHGQGPRRPRGDPPFDGAPAGLCRQGAVSGRAGHHRPGHRERLLLRLLLQAAVHAGRPGRHREADGRTRRQGRARRLAGCCRGTRRWSYFKSHGEHYKAEIIAGIPANEDVSLYREGGFEDLCRGPHVPSTGKLGTSS